MRHVLKTHQLMTTLGTRILLTMILTWLGAAAAFASGDAVEQAQVGLMESLTTSPWALLIALNIMLVLAGLFYVRSLKKMVQKRNQLLEETSKELHSLFDNMQETLYRTDLAGRIIMVTPSATKLLGYTSQELTHSQSADYYQQPEQQKTMLDILAKEGVVSNFRVALKRKDGHIVWAELNAHFFHDDEGKPIGIEGTLESIHSLKLAEDTEREARLIAEEANAHKSRFLAAASHDLRQPLQGMRFYLDVFADQLKGTPHLEMLAKISKPLDDANAMLNKLLDVARLDAGGVELNTQLFNLSEKLRDIYGQQLVALTKPKVHLRLDLAVQDCWVNSDPVLVKELIHNLLSNAIKYTEKGEVVLALSMKNNRVRISVRDTGLGIPPSRQEDIFHEFVQVGNAERNREQGMGLGLAISRRIARLLGSELKLVSELGKGSAFFFQLSSVDKRSDATTTQATAQLAKPTPLEGKLIVTIDDDAMIRESMGMLMKKWGCEVLSCWDLASANDALQQANRLPDAIISDFSLQGERNGIEVLDMLMKQAGKKIPALLLTGDSSLEMMERSATSGYPIVHKPISPEKLHRFLSQSIR